MFLVIATFWTGVAAVIVTFCSIAYISVVGEALHNYALSRLFELIPENDQPTQRRFETLCARDDEFIQVVELSRILLFVGNFLGWCMVMLSFSATLSLDELLWASMLSVASLVVCVLIVPPILLRHREEAALLVLLPTFAWISLPFRPLTLISSSVRRIGARIEGVEVKEDAQGDFEEGLADSLESAERGGVLDEEEREMIHNVVELGKTPASRAMIPRTDMACAEVDEGIEAVMRQAAQTGYTRIPVYEGSRDHIVGILHVADMMQHWQSGQRPEDLRKVVRPARFWPENKPLDDLLQEMRAEGLKIGILLDEHGGTAGMITIEDVLERIVGHLPSEHEHSAAATPADGPIAPFVNGTAEADADVDIDELNARLELELPNTPEYNSVGGLILHRLGRLALVGDVVECPGVKLTVKDADDRRIKRVKIERVAAPTDAGVA
ncbi:MAG: HlyC/CorC family transporter [Planctomycetes bacterium]|nr:HlyC/CorC family transporter [Planctomycetota bacterium]